MLQFAKLCFIRNTLALYASPSTHTWQTPALSPHTHWVLIHTESSYTLSPHTHWVLIHTCVHKHVSWWSTALLQLITCILVTIIFLVNSFGFLSNAFCFNFWILLSFLARSLQAITDYCFIVTGISLIYLK